MKSLNQFLIESVSDEVKVPSLSTFVDMLAGAKYHEDDLEKRAYFILNKAGISEEVAEKDLEKFSSSLQTYYDAQEKYSSDMDSLISSAPKSLSALFSFTSFEDKAASKYDSVKNSRNAAYDVLCKLINKYKGGKVSESLLEAKKDATPMENAIEICLAWRRRMDTDLKSDEEKKIGEGAIFFTIVDGLAYEGDTWGKATKQRFENLMHKSAEENEKAAADLVKSPEWKFILTGVEDLYKQAQDLEEMLDRLLEPIDDEDNPHEWKFSDHNQKIYDSELKELETMKKNFIANCRKLAK